MSDFIKEKVAFAVALLAVLFTTSSLATDTTVLGFELFGLHLTLRGLYLFVAGALGLSVYCYGVQFISERPLGPVERFGNALYAAALVAPGAYVAIWGSVQVAGLVRLPTVQPIIESVLQVAAGILSGVAVERLRRLVNLKDRQAVSAKGERERVGLLERARRLLDLGHSDLAVVEAFKALEVAARDLPPSTKDKDGRIPWRRIEVGLPKELRPEFHTLRQMRNLAAHGQPDLTQADAERALQLTSRILAHVSGSLPDEPERCSSCGSSDLEIEEGYSNDGFAYTTALCKACGAKNPGLLGT